MRRVITLLATALLALSAGAVPSAAESEPSSGYAEEQLNLGLYPTSPPGDGTTTPRVELTAGGVFHVRPGAIASFRFGARTWTEAGLDWSQRTLASGGSSDYLVSATAGSGAGSLVATVETLALGATRRTTSSWVSVPRIGTSPAGVAVAASGDHVYLALTQDSQDGRSAWLLVSDDRGATWGPPVDLLATAGLSATGERPRLQLRAAGGIVALVLGPDLLLVSRDAGSTWSDPTMLDEGAAARGPASVATDGTSVRVAWLRQEPDELPTLVSTSVGADGTLAGTRTVPTAPSPLSQGVQTEIVLAHLGSTYVLQAARGRLYGLDPDGSWRWALRRDPEITSDWCGSTCPTILPAAVYGDRMVRRGDGYFRWLFVDRTRPSITIRRPHVRVLEPRAQVGVMVRDDGELDLSTVSCIFDGRRRVVTSSGAPMCTAPRHMGGGRHTLVVSAADLAGNLATVRDAWRVWTVATPTWRHRPRAIGESRVRLAWSLDRTIAVRRQWIEIHTEDERGENPPYRVQLRRGERSHILRVRPGVRTCFAVRVAGPALRSAHDWTCTTIRT